MCDLDIENLLAEDCVIEITYVEYEIEGSLEDLESRLDCGSLPEKGDDWSSSSDTENTPKEEKEKFIDYFESLDANVVPGFRVVESHAEDRGIEDVESKVYPSNTLRPSILEYRSYFKHFKLRYTNPSYHCLVDAFF